MFASAAEKYTTKGHRMGLRERIVLGKAATLTLLLSDRFGAVSDAIQDRIRSADGTNLDTWVRRVLHAQTIDEVFTE